MIGNGITNIGFDAFWGCSILDIVYITDMEKWCSINFDGAFANPLLIAKAFLNHQHCWSLYKQEHA